MNGLYFLAPFLLVFLIGSISSQADAQTPEIEIGLNYDRQLVKQNADGSIQYTYTPRPDRIVSGVDKDGGMIFSNYILTEDETSVTFEAAHNTIFFNKTTNTLESFDGGKLRERVSDLRLSHVIKESPAAADVWTEFAISEPRQTQVIENDDGIQIISSIGDFKTIYDVNMASFEYTYEYTNNLPLKNNHKYGFTTICEGSACAGLLVDGEAVQVGEIKTRDDILNKPIEMGGKAFDLKNDEHDATWAINRIGEDRVAFDFTHSKGRLNLGQTLVVDPVLTADNPTEDGQISGDCTTAATRTTGGTIEETGMNSGTCWRNYFEYPISSIPFGATIDDVDWNYATAAGGVGSTACEVNAMALRPTTSTDQQVYDDIADGTQYATMTCNNAGASSQTVDLGTSADADIEANLGSGEYWFAIGVMFVTEANGNYSYLCMEENTCTPDPTLVITYTADLADAITDLTYANLGNTSVDLIWTEPFLNGGNVTNYMVNSTTPWSSATVFHANSTNIYYNVTGLTFGTDYSFEVAALTEIGYNFTGNVLNITTTYPLISGVAPTDLSVNDCSHTCSTQLNVEWVAGAMDNILGFRIFSETPIGGGFAKTVANTTTTTTYYNHTGLTAGQFYNYKVAAINASGISGNSTSYAYSPHKVPDAVDDLAITTNDLLQFLGSWTAPNLYGTLTGYQVNYTTPAGDPQTIYTSTEPDTNIAVGGLDPTTEHSFRVSAVTTHGTNATGNIENATLTVPIVIGDLDLSVQTNNDVNPIWYELFNIDSTTDDVQVRFASSLVVDCTVTDRLTNTDTDYIAIAETSASGYVYHNFTVTNGGNSILDWDCRDQTDPTINGQYTLTRNAASSGVGGSANVPLFAQIGNLSDGLYGTEGELAGIDLVTMLIVIISMLGFNRYNPAVGVGVMATFLGAAWYFELIPWTSGAFGGIALILVLAIGQGMKKR